jgi:hypothetical protein
MPSSNRLPRAEPVAGSRAAAAADPGVPLQWGLFCQSSTTHNKNNNETVEEASYA